MFGLAKLTRALTVLVALVAGGFAVGPSAEPAQAGVMDNVKGCYLAAEAAAQLAQTVTDPKFLACASQATSDPVLIAVSVVLAALAADGQFASEASCHEMVNNVAATFIGQALKAAGLDSQGQALMDALKQGGAAAVENLLAATPLGAEIDCGCSIAGNAVEAGKLMIAVAKHGSECAGLVTAVGAAFVDAVESGADAVGNYVQNLGGQKPAACTTGTGGYIYDPIAYGLCGSGTFNISGTSQKFGGHPGDDPTLGYQTLAGLYYDCDGTMRDECGLCDGAKMPKTPAEAADYKTIMFAVTGAGYCYCAPPASIKFKGASYDNNGKMTSQPKQAMCVCPNGLAYTSKGTCEACPFGTHLNAATGVCDSCPKGSLPNSQTGVCEPICKPSEVMLHPDQFYSVLSMNCSACPPDTIPTHPDKNSSVGSCTACPYDATSQTGDLTCTPRCDGNLGTWDPKTKSCKPLCPAGQHATYSGGEFPKMTCQSCPNGQAYNVDTHSCSACPAGASWSGNGGFGYGGWCQCPEGQSNSNGVCKVCQGVGTSTPQGGTCLPCPGSSVWTSDGKGGGYCYAKRPPRVCHDNSVPDPKAPYTNCIPCPSNTTAQGAMCVPNVKNRLPEGGYKAPTAGDMNKPFKVNCPPGSRDAGGYCESTLQDGGVAPAQGDSIDCGKLGNNYVKDAAHPGSCRKCPAGRIANNAKDVCVMGFSTPQMAPQGTTVMPQQPPGRNATPGTAAPQPTPPSGGKPF